MTELTKLLTKLKIIAVLSAIIVVAALLYLFNFVVETYIFLLTIPLALLSFWENDALDKWLERNKVSVKAQPEEVKREDDILLQGTTFCSAILFFYVNLILSSGVDKISLSILIVAFGIPFYCSRAYAKIKDSPKYRYYSMYLLAFLLGTYIISISVTISVATFSSILNNLVSVFIFLLFLLTPISLLQDALGSYFKTRYGFDDS